MRVRSAEAFHKRVHLTGVILTKLDGDARGGAALSVAAVTGVPVRFAGTGEKNDALEVFDPSRMAGRILGMGDMLGLIEKAEESFDQEKRKSWPARCADGNSRWKSSATPCGRSEKWGRSSRSWE